MGKGIQPVMSGSSNNVPTRVEAVAGLEGVSGGVCHLPAASDYRDHGNHSVSALYIECGSREQATERIDRRMKGQIRGSGNALPVIGTACRIQGVSAAHVVLIMRYSRRCLILMVQ